MSPMDTATVVMRHDSSASGPVRTGVTLSGTVAVFYTLCTLVWVVAPGPFLSFMNSLFHGMDFTPLLRATAFSWSGFVEALVVMAIWAFLAGTFFGWLHQRIRGA